MQCFSYKAYDREGTKVEGEIEALNVDAASVILGKQGYMIVSISENTIISKELSFLSRSQISAEELESLTSELSLLLNSGVTIDRGLAVLRRTAASLPQAKLIVSLHDAVRRGESLSDAMAAEGDSFSKLYINLVMLGESSGTLPKVFARLAEDIKFQLELKRKVTQALTYPAIIFSVCILSIVFIFNYIVPQMSGLFAGMTSIPAYTAILLGISDWMIQYQWFLLTGVIAIFLTLVSLARSTEGSRRLNQVLIQVPVLRNVFFLLERIRFNTAISMMLESGILIDQCLEMGVGSVKNQPIKQGLIVAKERVKKGEALSSALRVSPLYLDYSLSLIEVGEESGQLGPVFAEISTRSRRDFETWVDRMTSMLEPILILVMGGIVGGVVVTMLLSIVAVNDIGI